MCKSTLQSLLLAGLFATSTTALAQGFYEFIPYYNNDPFTFCTKGVLADCWAPVNPATGTYTITDQHCFNEASAALFARVCPHAFGDASIALHIGRASSGKEI